MARFEPRRHHNSAVELLLYLLALSACGGQSPAPGDLGAPSGAVSSAVPGAGAAGAAPAAAMTGAAGNSTPVASGVAGSAPTGPAMAAAANTPGGMAAMPAANNAAAGAQAPAATTTTTPPGAAMDGTAQPGGAPTEMAMDECDLHTNYPGDEYCILPPPPDKGFQLHIGPSSYDNPEPIYVLSPGQEITTDTFSDISSNDKEQFFYYRQYRMRPGAHHNIITSGGGGDTGLGQRIGTVNTLSEDYPKGGIIAPENEDVGIRMPAHTTINVSLHSINTTDKPELREIWINFWYRDPSVVKEPVKEVFSVAPMGGIPPHADVMINGSCTTDGDGRMLWAYGHRHANNVSFSIWHQHGGMKDLVYQGYNWEEPITFDYSSTVTNPTPDLDKMIEGGWSGILAFKAGDQFVVQCHVINKTDGTLYFTNNTYTGEMCILDAETVGGGCN